MTQVSRSPSACSELNLFAAFSLLTDPRENPDAMLGFHGVGPVKEATRNAITLTRLKAKRSQEHMWCIYKTRFRI